MASNRIKGITIEINGDTTKLDKAIAGTDTVLKNVQSDLRAVERGLKMDPGNAELIAQKQRLLGEALALNKDRLKTLEESAKDVYQAFAEGKISTAQLDAFNLEIDLTRAKVHDSEKAVKDFSESSSQLGGAAKQFDAAGSMIAKSAGVIAEGAATAAKAATAAVGAASVAVGALVKESVQSYSGYEQLVGGVETLFKSSSQTVLKYAQNAYRTAGLSANDYLDTVTSFSASLLQGLRGNTEKAAELADLAITDMADNANKMGSDMASIQSAYQGFAKQNYTMLDNLKLGYGGTQEEMVRLINDSGILNHKIEDLSNISFDQIVRAIHEVQTQMGITGTTALEASTTIQGSASAVRAAWENLMVGLADENADVGSLVENLVDSLFTLLENVLPAVERVLAGVADAIVSLIPTLAERIPEAISTVLPDLIDTGAQLLQAILEGLTDALPQLIPALGDVAQTIATVFMDLAPQLAETGGQLLAQLVAAITDGIPSLADAALEAAGTFADGIDEWLPAALDSIRFALLHLLEAIVESAPKFLGAAWTIVSSLLQGLIEYLPTLMEWIPHVIESLTETLIENLPAFGEMAGEMAGALLNGLIDALPKIVAAVPDIVMAIIDAFGALMGAFVDLGAEIIQSIIDGILGGGDKKRGGTPVELAFPEYSSYSLRTASAGDLPHLARGTVAQPNRPFAAVIGDNTQEPEVVSPLSTIRQAVREANAASGGRSGPMNVILTVNGELAPLVRLMNPQIRVENQRLGPQLVT